jgi:hypothetical protein
VSFEVSNAGPTVSIRQFPFIPFSWQEFLYSGALRIPNDFSEKLFTSIYKLFFRGSVVDALGFERLLQPNQELFPNRIFERPHCSSIFFAQLIRRRRNPG